MHTVCNVQLSLCGVLCTLFSVQCAVLSQQSTAFSDHCTVFSVQCVVCSVQCAVCSVQCAVCSLQCAVCSVFCAVCSVLCALSTREWEHKSVGNIAETNENECFQLKCPPLCWILMIRICFMSPYRENIVNMVKYLTNPERKSKFRSKSSFPI